MTDALARDGHERATGSTPPVRASTLKGMPVVSMAQGIKVGDVSDLSIDGGALRVFGLALGASDGAAVVPFSAIHSIGPDAITLADAEAVAKPRQQSAEPGLPNLHGLTGLPVVDGGGTVLGHLKDLELDRHDGRIIALAVESGGVLGLGARTLTILAERIRSLGPALVTVDAAQSTEA